MVWGCRISIIRAHAPSKCCREANVKIQGLDGMTDIRKATQDFVHQQYPKLPSVVASLDSTQLNCRVQCISGMSFRPLLVCPGQVRKCSHVRNLFAEKYPKLPSAVASLDSAQINCRVQWHRPSGLYLFAPATFPIRVFPAQGWQAVQARQAPDSRKSEYVAISKFQTPFCSFLLFSY